MYCAFQIDFESLNNKQDATDGVCIVFVSHFQNSIPQARRGDLPR